MTRLTPTRGNHQRRLLVARARPIMVGVRPLAIEGVHVPQIPLPEDLEDWWSTTLDSWWRDFDSFDHITGSSYGAIFEEAFGRFAASAWGTSTPGYVVAHMSIDFVREIRRHETPLTVRLGIGRIGQSSIGARLVLQGPDGDVRSIASNRYIAWDIQQRRPRMLTPDERRSLEPFVRVESN